MSGVIPWGKKLMPVMYQLHVTLLPLVLTLFFFLSVEVTGASIPTRELAKQALETVGKFLKDDTGSSWLASVSKDRIEPLTIEELMREMINSTLSEVGVRKAAEIIALALEHQRISGKTTESLIIEPERLKKFIETLADRDDIICIYRNTTHGSTRRFEDWEKIMKDATANYRMNFALNTGSQYFSCLKKIVINSITTEPTTETTDRIIINSTTEITSTAIAEKVLHNSLRTWSDNKIMRRSGPINDNNSLDNDDEEMEKSSSEDCENSNGSCTSSLITSAPSISESSASDSASVEFTTSNEENSVMSETRLMQEIIADGNGESMDREVNRDTNCSNSMQTSQQTFHHSQNLNSKDSNFRDYINRRHFSQEILNSREFPISIHNPLYKSSNYAIYICRFNKICQLIKTPESRQQLTDIIGDLKLNNESPEELANLQRKHPGFSYNANEFVKNLHDNGILIYQTYPKYTNTHLVALKRNNNNNEYGNLFGPEYHRNFISRQDFPLSKFVTRQLLRTKNPHISREPEYIHYNSGQFDTSEHRKKDKILSLKIFVNNPTKEPVKLSIYTDLDPQIEVYHNKKYNLDNVENFQSGENLR